MPAKAAENCWEHWKCTKAVKEKCAAYTTDSGRECWMVVGSNPSDVRCPKIKNGFKSCLECTWFKKLNPKF